MADIRPIIFSAQMVRALLDGRKTQTRRLIIQNCDFCCPYGQPGDLLWVRETWCIGDDLGEGWEEGMCGFDRFVGYPADGSTDYQIVPDDFDPPRNAKETHNDEGTPEHWRKFGPIPSIFMPRWASRLTLEITEVRVQRLQEISGRDAWAEGIPCSPDVNPLHEFQELWESIHGAGSWAENPWLWCLTFEVIRANVDSLREAA